MVNILEFYEKFYNIDKTVIENSQLALTELSGVFKDIDTRAEIGQMKVLKAMQENGLSDIHFNYTTGYGYSDDGRDILEKIYKDVYNTENALVRPQIISGTHALTVALAANLKYGDELISISGTPYDTLQGVIGIRPTRNSLMENGVTYDECSLTSDYKFDFDAIKKVVKPTTKMVAIQRSKGYDWRNSLTVSEIGEAIKCVKEINKDIIIMVDNCYGEFVETIEPTDVGADLCVGSLIKNAGGGLSPIGGYIVGKYDLVENCADRLSAPGLGKKVGATLGVSKTFLQGLFFAPTVTASALKTAIFTAKMFEKLGFEVSPKSTDVRTDIVQAIKFKDREKLIAFCQGIQLGAPVDSFVTPEPWDMPGYDNEVIMAAGAFIQGSSIELSADAPIKEPYIAYMQGGLTFEHGKIGVILAINNMVEKGLIKF